MEASMPTQVFKIEEFYAHDHTGKPLFWVSGCFKATAEWDGVYGWQVTRIEGSNNETPEHWERIDDVPEARAICRGIEAHIATLDAPYGYSNPNAEHMLGARELGIGRFA
jgi:hypothetical protein